MCRTHKQKLQKLCVNDYLVFTLCFFIVIIVVFFSHLSQIICLRSAVSQFHTFIFQATVKVENRSKIVRGQYGVKVLALFVPNIAANRCCCCSVKSLKGILSFLLPLSLLLRLLLLLWLNSSTDVCMLMVMSSNASKPLQREVLHKQTVALIIFTKCVEQSLFNDGAWLHERLVILW